MTATASENQKRMLRLPAFRAEEMQAAAAETAAIFDQITSVATAPIPDYRTAYTICMTPRSGSTFLAQAMSKSAVFGHPQEYLHRLEPSALAAHAARYGAKSWESYLAALAAHTRTGNGVFGLKADPNMLLPLLIDGTFDRTLAHGKFIYVTRTDLVMQAISLTKAQYTGSWSSQVDPIAVPQFSFGAIYGNILHLAEMMGRWESFFAYNGIAPLRITYERIDADIDAVLRDIASFLHVASPKPSARGAKAHQRDDVSIAWRHQFQAALAPTQFAEIP
ncbi:MAG: hypothetical protein EPO08_05905 [Rhodospirillaceae bacterium]|nr:MAG: hypothetical protein EPO08_05905 [Rhodospirillaceae bacterium]